MYVCVCFAVTEDEIQEVIDNGAGTRDAVTKQCRAGGDCGSCHSMIDSMITESNEPIPCDRLIKRRRRQPGEAA